MHFSSNDSPENLFVSICNVFLARNPSKYFWKIMETMEAHNAEGVFEAGHTSKYRLSDFPFIFFANRI